MITINLRYYCYLHRSIYSLQDLFCLLYVKDFELDLLHAPIIIATFVNNYQQLETGRHSEICQ